MRKPEETYRRKWNAELEGDELRWHELTPEQRAKFINAMDEVEARREELEAQIAEKDARLRRLESEMAVAQERHRMAQEHGLFTKLGASPGPKLF